MNTGMRNALLARKGHQVSQLLAIYEIRKKGKKKV